MALIYRLFLLPNGDGTYRRVHVPFDDNSEQYRKLYGRDASGDPSLASERSEEPRVFVATLKPTLH
jgi:hypothetical protein